MKTCRSHSFLSPLLSRGEEKKIFSSTEDSLKFDRVEKTTISFPLELSNTLSITLLAYFSSGASIGYKFYSIQRSWREIITGGRDREDDTDSYIFDIFDKFGRGPAWYYFSGLVAIVNLDGGAEYIRRPPTLSTFPFTFIYRVYLYIYIYIRARFEAPHAFNRLLASRSLALSLPTSLLRGATR